MCQERKQYFPRVFSALLMLSVVLYGGNLEGGDFDPEKQEQQYLLLYVAVEIKSDKSKRLGACFCLVPKLCCTLCNPMNLARQAPLSMGFSRQEYWSGLPFPSPGDLPEPGIKPGSPALQADSLLTEL